MELIKKYWAWIVAIVLLIGLVVLLRKSGGAQLKWVLIIAILLGVAIDRGITSMKATA